MEGFLFLDPFGGLGKDLPRLRGLMGLRKLSEQQLLGQTRPGRSSKTIQLTKAWKRRCSEGSAG